MQNIKMIDLRRIFSKCKIILISCLVLNLCADCFSAPVSCPAQKTTENFYNIPLNIGFETDYIVERKVYNRDDAGDDVSLEGLWTAAKLGYTWYDWIETYVLFGGMDWDVTQKKTNNSEIKYFANREFAWGWGVEALLLKQDNGISIAADTRMRQQHPDMERVQVDGLTTKNLTTGGSFREWQLSLAIAWDLAKVIYSPQKFRYIPYAGVKLSKIRLHSEANVLGTEYKVDDGRAADSYGVFLGCDIYLFEAPENENFGLNIEGRFIDELAFSVSVNYKF